MILSAVLRAAVELNEKLYGFDNPRESFSLINLAVYRFLSSPNCKALYPDLVLAEPETDIFHVFIKNADHESQNDFLPVFNGEQWGFSDHFPKNVFKLCDYLELDSSSFLNSILTPTPICIEGVDSLWLDKSSDFLQKLLNENAWMQEIWYSDTSSGLWDMEIEVLNAQQVCQKLSAQYGECAKSLDLRLEGLEYISLEEEQARKPNCTSVFVTAFNQYGIGAILKLEVCEEERWSELVYLSTSASCRCQGWSKKLYEKAVQITLDKQHLLLRTCPTGAAMELGATQAYDEILKKYQAPYCYIEELNLEGILNVVKHNPMSYWKEPLMYFFNARDALRYYGDNDDDKFGQLMEWFQKFLKDSATPTPPTELQPIKKAFVF